MKRDDVIKQVAAFVGDRHRVDLKHYDLLILIEIYQVSSRGVYGEIRRAAIQRPRANGLRSSQNICGMSVVGHDFDKLKRFNLAEIYDPRPKAADAGPARMES